MHDLVIPTRMAIDAMHVKSAISHAGTRNSWQARMDIGDYAFSDFYNRGVGWRPTRMAITTMTAGAVVKFKDGETEVVKPPCENKTNGYWYCATCKQQINLNFAPSKHDRGHHEMVWMCWEHGPEQPQ